MTPSTLGDLTVREVPLLREDDEVLPAVKRIIELGVPALPVVDADDKFVGIFGEREFISAVFPGYLGQLRSAAFVPHAIDDVIDRRLGCGREPVSKYANTEHVDVGPDYSDAQLAEIFLHHRVLIIPVIEDRQVAGIVTRTDFFQALAKRFLER